MQAKDASRTASRIGWQGTGRDQQQGSASMCHHCGAWYHQLCAMRLRCNRRSRSGLALAGWHSSDQCKQAYAASWSFLCKAAQLPHHHCMAWLALPVGTGLHRHGGMPLHLLFGCRLLVQHICQVISC
jgi:hypothetical protein